MMILFCQEPFATRNVDTSFEVEAEAAKAAGFSVGLMDYESLVSHGQARIKTAENTTNALYRGWMLRSEEYTQLHSQCASQGIQLINSPEQYIHCHHLPASYPIIEAHTAKTVWVELPSQNTNGAILNALHSFGASPIIVKDYVKSEKHYWHEACFIPDASNKEHARRVIDRFLELRGDSLVGGLVLREFLELEPIGPHPQSGMPQFMEYRLFFLDHKLLTCTPYWDAQTSNTPPPLHEFEQLAQHIQSRFFTIDIARLKNGRWVIIELGDGQVTGLPSQLDPATFYQRIWNCTSLKHP
jgi:hypothetical protein